MQIQIGASESEMTEAVETQILAHVKALEDYVNDLTGCTKCLQHLRFIVIEKAGRVRIHLDVPGGELTIDKQNSVDLPLAITQAFTAARFKLEEYVHKLRHDVKIQGVLLTSGSPRFFRRTVTACWRHATGGKSIFVLTVPPAHAATRPARDRRQSQ